MYKLEYKEDERGYFRELFKCETGLPQIKQVSKFTINPGKWRGLHYHKETWEVFIVENGTLEFRVENVDTGEFTSKNLTAGNAIVVSPYMDHELRSADGCEIIVLSSKIFDPNNTDTYVKVK